MSKVRGHTFWHPKMKGTVKSFPGICTHCGLVALKNDATRRAIKDGCRGAACEDQDLTPSRNSGKA